MFSRALRPRVHALFLILTVGLVVAAVAASPDDPTPLSVHEWGTFTSIAGRDGAAVAWTPLNGQDDLPCFVNRMRFGPKWTLRGRVRMETPVLYFYAPNDVTVDVKVEFRQGVITEWFPAADVRPDQLGMPPDRDKRLIDHSATAAWTGIRVRPGATPVFPREDSPSHYYPARETDAAPVQVGESLERFLFYRGVGDFAPPVNAIVETDGRIVVSAPSGAPLGDIVAFDNRGGTVKYLTRRVDSSKTTIDPNLLEARSSAALNQHLEQVLTAQGLHPKEARAMIATWRDTWFEEGTRLFYIAPRRVVDAVLPLEITPKPADVARVFVGRIELVTPRMSADLKDGFKRNDQQALARFGRFLEPFMDRLFAESSVADQQAMDPARQVIYRNWRPPLSACRD